MDSNGFVLEWDRDKEGHIIGLKSNKGWKISPATDENGDIAFMTQGISNIGSGVLPAFWLHGTVTNDGTDEPVSISFSNNYFQPSGMSVMTVIETILKNGGSFSTYMYDAVMDYEFALEGKIKLIGGEIEMTATNPKNNKSTSFRIKLSLDIATIVDTFIKEIQYLPVRIG